MTRWRILIALVSVGLGTIAAGIVGIVMHEYFHGPFMFISTDPPAADPFRNRHVALGWIVTYGMIGFAGGIVASLGLPKKRFLPIALIPVLVLVFLRLTTTHSYLTTEEGRYGIPSAAAFGAIGGLLVMGVAARLRTHREPGAVGNEGHRGAD
jgi:hypothetical protein